MKRTAAILTLAALAMAAPWAGAQEKIKYGSSVRLAPPYYLPVLAAEERGIFKKNGVNVEWFPSNSGTDMQRGLAADAFKIGSSSAGADIPSMGRGVPVVIIASLQPTDDFAVWVSAKGKRDKVADLKGAKLGVSRFGGLEHAYGQLVAKQSRMDKDIQFISTGGIKESLAVLVTGGIDGVVLSSQQMIDFKLKGIVRELAKVDDFRPKPWAAYTIVARREFIQKEPDTARRIVRSILEANKYIMSKEGKPWTIAKMREINNYSPEGAEFVYTTLSLSPDGKIERQAVANLANFMIDYGLIKKDELPPMDSIVDDRFVR
jgi:ABC-type nitrate/sulfonate/bicarbonate transport system substrate-binding protein